MGTGKRNERVAKQHAGAPRWQQCVDARLAARRRTRNALAHCFWHTRLHDAIGQPAPHLQRNDLARIEVHHWQNRERVRVVIVERVVPPVQPGLHEPRRRRRSTLRATGAALPLAPVQWRILVWLGDMDAPRVACEESEVADAEAFPHQLLHAQVGSAHRHEMRCRRDPAGLAAWIRLHDWASPGMK
jgi:hypothetical protein